MLGARQFGFVSRPPRFFQPHIPGGVYPEPHSDTLPVASMAPNESPSRKSATACRGRSLTTSMEFYHVFPGTSRAFRRKSGAAVFHFRMSAGNRTEPSRDRAATLPACRNDGRTPWFGQFASCLGPVSGSSGREFPSLAQGDLELLSNGNP